MSSYVKHPDARLDYGFDWSRWLSEGDTIASSSWTVDSGLDVGESEFAEDFDDTTTKIWLSGGDDGVDYEAVNRIITAQGRDDRRTMTIKVRVRR